MVIIARDLPRHELNCKEGQKECAHCKEKFKAQNLVNHSANCSKRPIKCVRCSKQYAADTIVAHSRQCVEVPKRRSSGSAVDISTTPSAKPGPKPPVEPPSKPKVSSDPKEKRRLSVLDQLHSTAEG